MSTTGSLPAQQGRGVGLPAARLADVRQQHDPLCLLVCEPDAEVMALLLADLAHYNVEVVTSSDGARALFDAGRLRPELLVLSADLPIVSAAEVIKTLRQVSDAPVVVGSGDGQDELLRPAVAAGADRVLPRPYPIAELRPLMLRVRARHELDNVVITAGALAVDPLGYEVRLRGRRIPMSVRELEVLLYLIQHQGRVVSVEELRDALWPRERLSPQSNVVAVCVVRLRAHLEDGCAPSTIIRTVRGRGYRFYPPGEAPNAAVAKGPAT